jgi:H3 lysine-79-specific histone-lysine N-methyltransferase
MFLDLKDGAIIVSLKPFVPTDFRMNESNVSGLDPYRIAGMCVEYSSWLQCDSFAAIVKLTQHTYHKDWVTWKGDSGVYYVQVIDRSMRRKYEENMNGGRKRR